ncbi:MAG: 4-(cytidine 5'-diphospho)-2-C-methyl-D-erythritol kinase [Clostridia bacterium]|nr:4-(cytidine 5'-diphospho)-2-C-methyl-D-erythritol kinase [Clostridia bacterium]
MNTVTLRSYAKINLSLDVTGVREDGYHLLESVFQQIGIYDNIRVRREHGNGGIRIRCNLPFIPTDERNIVHKTAAAFFKAAGIEEYQISIDLRKTVPSGAGLGGGSANGATVFSALCRLYGVSFSTKEAIRILCPLGADIPFFLFGGTRLATGVGEVLTPAPPLKDCFILLAKPKAGASTKQIFEKLEETGIPRHPDTPGVLKALENGDIKALAAASENVLETATFALKPQVQELKEAMQKEGAAMALMSGSGSCVFGIFENEKEARRAMKNMRQYTRTVFLTRPIHRPARTDFGHS